MRRFVLKCSDRNEYVIAISRTVAEGAERPNIPNGIEFGSLTKALVFDNYQHHASMVGGDLYTYLRITTTVCELFDPDSLTIDDSKDD